MIPNSEFANLREKAGLTIDEAADLLGKSPRTVRRYEEGRETSSTPPMLVIEALKRVVLDRTLHGPGAEKGFRFIDLFAGIGGLRTPFEEIGGKCVFTSEWDRFARQTYSANFSVDEQHEFAGDIRPYAQAPDLIPEHDVMLAGFPCQPFSIAGVSKKNSLGRPHGFLCDTQGTLFYDLAKIIEHHRPPVFLLENVKNLERHDGGKTFATIRHVLENELGYHIHTRIISSDPWVPQKRERIFIVGFRSPNSFDFDCLDVPAGQKTRLGDILEPGVDPKYTLSPKLWNYLQGYKEKHNRAGNGFGYSLFGPDDVTRTLSARYYKDGSEILVRQTGDRPRRLTPRECSRLMGFDAPGESRFKIPVSDTQAYRQFGNSVVVPVVRAVATLLKPHLFEALALRDHVPAQIEMPLRKMSG
ncbi:MAG: DNA (cytosine-5-)-methyltransferase [Rhodospirillales bacterium]|nr:DNA (cytosine-5-)-methyltransferase [Rhodospirillales bacterium]